MKKPQFKNEEKGKYPLQGDSEKNNEGVIIKPPTNNNYFLVYNSLQNLRPANLVLKDANSPNKIDPSVRNSRRPDFFKNFNKNAVIQQGLERRSFKEFTTLAREQPVTDFKNKESPNKIKIAKNKELRQTIKSDISQFQKLNNKLNYIQNKIQELSSNIDKKRQQKWNFLQAEKKDRMRRLQKNNSQTEPSKNTESLKKFVTQANDGKDYVPCSTNPYSPRHNVYYITQILKFYKNQRSLARQHVTTSAQYLKIFDTRKAPQEQEVAAKALKLSKKPFYQDKKTVIFDLDQTLIHCNQSLDAPYDVKIKIKFPTGEQIEAGINIRPYAFELLKALSRNFQVIVFTASHSCYANVVLDHLDPQGQYVQHRLYRQNCSITSDGVYVKDLRVINRDISEMVLVDNAAYSYAYQLDNAIPIIPYYKGKNDFQLRALQTYIEGMLFAKDVREFNRKTFKLHRYRQFNDIDVLVKDLYGQYL